jgi:hypothetical protein
VLIERIGINSSVSGAQVGLAGVAVVVGDPAVGRNNDVLLDDDRPIDADGGAPSDMCPVVDLKLRALGIAGRYELGNRWS